jgi:predicted choloylglycine hydrolase
MAIHALLGLFDPKIAEYLKESTFPDLTPSMFATFASYATRYLGGEVIPSIKNRVIKLTEADPFKRGKEHGELCKDEITLMIFGIEELYVKREGGDRLLKKAKALEPHIPAEFIQEMKGLAEGAGVTYEKVLIANTIIDTMQLFGCSLYAVSEDRSKGEKMRELATNYFDTVGQKNSENIDSAFKRFNSLLKTPFSSDTDAMKGALKKVNCDDTVQSIVFDTATGSIELATAGNYSATSSYSTFTGEELFGSVKIATGKKVVKLARNLDWPITVLGPTTNVMVYPAVKGKYKTAVVGWPGMLGALSGINEKGLAISISVVPSKKQAGIPNQFLFKKILQEAKTITEAAEIVKQHKCASPMNLMVAAVDGIARFELDPKRKQTGPATISFGRSAK